MASRPRPGAGLRVLVVLGDAAERAATASVLRGLGCAPVESASLEGALGLLSVRPFDAALVDLRLGAHGPAAVAAASAALDVVAVGGEDPRDLHAARAASDLIVRPLDEEALGALVARLLSRRALATQVLELRAELSRALPEVETQTRSPAMRALLGVLGGAAAHDVPVLLRGAPGSGRSTLARRLHALSPRRARPFVVVACAAPSEERLGSALFGHARGAFEGAPHDQPGRLEEAAGGTVLLDEIGELPGAIQERLVELLGAGTYRRLGETRTRVADVRIVAATARDPDVQVALGRLLPALRDALSTVALTVPALRERREDILPLAERFLSFYGRASPHAPHHFTDEAEVALVTYAWPGHIRELRNAVEGAVMSATSPALGPELLPARITDPRPAPALPAVGGDFTLEEVEREHTLRVLARAATLDDAARILGVDPTTLWRRRRRG